jgi:hypothetical protein
VHFPSADACAPEQFTRCSGLHMAPCRAYPHRTDRRQGEKHTSVEYVQTSDIGSTAWGWEHMGEPEPSHTQHGGMQAQMALRMSERWYAEGTVCCPSFQSICMPERQTDQQGQTGSLRPSYHRVNQYEWLPGSLTIYVVPRALGVIQEESPSKEPPLVFHSVPPRRVSHCSDVRHWSLSQQYYRIGYRLIFFMVLSRSFKRYVMKRGAGSFTGTAIHEETKLNSRLSGERDFGRERAILGRFSLRNRRRKPATGGIKRWKTPKSSGLCRRGDLHHDPTLGITSEELLYEPSLTITKPKGKSYAIGGPQLYAPYHEDNCSWLPSLHHADGRRSAWLLGTCGWLHCSPQTAVTRQDGTTRPTATRPLRSLPPGPQPGYYVGMRDLRPGGRT